MDSQSKFSSQENLVKDLREATDKYKETEARQASLISTLRERIHNTEQEMLSIASFKNITDLKLQVLTKENEDLKERELKMETQSKYVFRYLFLLTTCFCIHLYTWKNSYSP